MKLENVNKIYEGHTELHVLKDINCEFKENNFYAIMGRSGSGKSTLIHIIGLLDNYTSGKYYINNKEVSSLTNDEKDDFRAMNIGFVFQNFYLNDKLTSLENVLIATFINKNMKKSERKKKVKDILIKLGLKDKINQYPKKMSGGECQRVAIARALVNNPKIIIADEPTGNLDSVCEKEIFEILKKISKQNKIVIVVTHNEKIKNYCDVLYTINDGHLEKGVL